MNIYGGSKYQAQIDIVVGKITIVKKLTMVYPIKVEYDVSPNAIKVHVEERFEPNPLSSQGTSTGYTIPMNIFLNCFKEV